MNQEETTLSTTDEDLTIGIVVSDYYPEISDRLLSGALQELESHKEIQWEVVRVSGAWEIPIVVATMIENEVYDGMIALGCVIRGETNHFDYLCDHTARALMDISLELYTPIGFGVLTVENESQALARSQLESDSRNKGREAAMAVVRTINTIDDFIRNI